jgi:hypothetical protein
MDRNQVKAREIAARIPLDYYKQPDPVFMKKTMLWKGALIAAGVWIFTMFAPGKVPVVGANRFSHGPVCRVHAAFEHECTACHVSFPFVGGKEADGAFKGDAKCMECHLSNGGATHSPHQKVAMTPNCGVCHTDHKGANFDLRRAGNNHCIVCHKDLPASMEDPSKCKYEKVVTSFPDPDKHPDFRSIKSDPSKIKFNHKYHLTPGIVLTDGGTPFKVKDMTDGPGGPSRIKKSVLERQKNPDVAVALDCRDCHTTQETGLLTSHVELPEDPLSDAAKKSVTQHFASLQEQRGRTSTGQLRPPHVPGAYMEPVDFDNHCAACHSLKFDAKLPAVSHKQAGTQDEQLTLLRKQVERMIGDASLPKLDHPPQLGLPGKKPDVGQGSYVDAAMRSLLEGKRVCGECHVDASGSDLTVSSTKIAASNIPAEWFEHARFKHRPHEFMECRDCHAQAYPSNNADLLANYAKPRKGADDVMIPDINNCRQCHTPKPTISTRTPAGYDCAECHGYHNGKAPHQK